MPGTRRGLTAGCAAINRRQRGRHPMGHVIGAEKVERRALGCGPPDRYPAPRATNRSQCRGQRKSRRIRSDPFGHAEIIAARSSRHAVEPDQLAASRGNEPVGSSGLEDRRPGRPHRHRQRRLVAIAEADLRLAHTISTSAPQAAAAQRNARPGGHPSRGNGQRFRASARTAGRACSCWVRRPRRTACRSQRAALRSGAYSAWR